MNNINFIKPIVLRKSLEDMNAEQKKQAMLFIGNVNALTLEGNRTKIIPIDEATHNEHPVCFFGSEAVCIYRQTLGLPDVAIHSINVDEIFEHTFCYTCLQDITYFLHRLDARNKRFHRLATMSAPPVIMMNEYRMLQECVEFLQDNNWSGHPMIDSYDITDADGEAKHYDDVRKSLIDIEYDLVAGACDIADV